MDIIVMLPMKAAEELILLVLKIPLIPIKLDPILPLLLRHITYLSLMVMHMLLVVAVEQEAQVLGKVSLF